MSLKRYWAVLAAVLALATVLSLLRAEDEPLSTEAAIDKDRQATSRFLGIRLEREKMLMRREVESEALKTEAEVLRHEIKCLERYIWCMRRDTRLAPRGKALATVLARLKTTQPKDSLADRTRRGFTPNDAVANPMGVAVADLQPASEPVRAVSTFQVRDVTVGKPKRTAVSGPDSRFDGVKPPGGASPGEGGDAGSGSAGSGGSATDRR